MSFKTNGDLEGKRRLIAGKAVNLPDWTPSFDYKVNDIFLEAGEQYIVIADHTSPAIFDADNLNIAQSSGNGLRGEPIADNTALTALIAKDYEKRKVLADGKEYVFELGAVSGTLADDGATGFWQEQISDKPTYAVTVSTGIDISPDFDVNQEFTLLFNDTSAGDINFNNSSTSNLETAEKVRITISNTDTIARNLVFGSEYVDTENNAIGSLELPVGTLFRVLEFVRFGSSSLVLQSDTLQSAAQLESTKIDSSAGVITETLDASTNLGGVRLFTNIDVTNTATLAVQAGETLRGVIDGTFLFSHYPVGTQFRADEVTGGWVISVVGASEVRTSNSYGLFDFDGGMQQNQNSYLRSQTASTNLRVDANNQVTWNEGVNPDTFQIPVGIWKITVSMQFPTGNNFFNSISNFRFGNQGSDGTQPTGVTLLESHVEDQYDTASVTRNTSYQVYLEITQPVEGNWYYTGTNGGDTGNVYVEFDRLDRSEVVLAGMVTPTSLTSAQISTGASDLTVAGVSTGVGTIIPFSATDFNNGMTLASAGEITVIESGRYEFESYLSIGTINLDADFIVVVDGVSVFSSFSNLLSGNDNRVISYELDLTAGQVVGLYHKPIGGGDNVAIRPNSYFRLTQLPTSTVVMPDALAVGDTRVLLGSATGITNGQQVTISQTWGSLEAEYEYVEFHIFNSNEASRNSIKVLTKSWDDNTNVRFQGDGTTLADLNNMDISGTTADFIETATAYDTADIEVYGVKAQKTVINTTDLPAAGVTSWSDGDFGVWNATSGQFEPAVLSEVTGTNVTDTLNQISGTAWSVNTSTSPANLAFNWNSDFASYVQEGNKRYYSMRMYLDNDSVITFGVTGAKDVVSVQGIGSSLGSGDFANRMCFVKRDSANVISIDRDNDNDVDMFIDITFTAIM